MKVRTSATTTSKANRSAGSRRRLRTRSRKLPEGPPRGGPSASRQAVARGLLDTHRGLPELLDPRLVVGRPLAVVGHELHLVERRRPRRRRDTRERRPTVAELHVERARLRRENPVDEGLRRGEVLRAVDDADRADLEARVRWNGEVDRIALALLGQDVVAPVRAADILTLVDEEQRTRRRRDVLGDVGV